MLATTTFSFSHNVFFLPFPGQISIFDTHLNCRLQMLSIWTGLKSCRLAMSQMYVCHIPSFPINIS